MITLEQLERRYGELQRDFREAEAAWIEKRGGYKYVLGELEGMIRDVKARLAAEAEQAVAARLLDAAKGQTEGETPRADDRITE
jgi:hypothetical protein